MEFHGKTDDFPANEHLSRSQLCNWCLVNGRALTEVVHVQELTWYLNTIGGSATLQGQVPILNQIPQVCWECRAMLTKVLAFSEQVLESYEKQQSCITQEDKDLQVQLQPIEKTSKLDIFNINPIDIQPVLSEFHITDVKDEPNAADAEFDIDIEEHFENTYLLDKSTINNFNLNKDSDNVVNEQTSNVGDWTINEKEKYYKYNCDKCDAGFTSKSSLVHHIVWCYRSSEMKTVVTRQKKIKHSKNQPNSSSLNKTCSKRAGNKKRLKCKICEATFKSYAYLNKHISRTHTNYKQYKCDLCPYASARRDCLQKHYCIHTKERQFVCQTCGASFAQACNLTKHLRVHTGARPYKCEVCEYSSPRGDDLKGHMRRHLNERRYVCGICNAPFILAHELTLHLRKKHNS